MNKVTFDVETTTHNFGNPFHRENWLVSYSIKIADEDTIFSYYQQPDFKNIAAKTFSDPVYFIGANAKFDLHWLRNLGIRLAPNSRVWDVQLAEYVLSGQSTSFASLDSLLEKYGLPKKIDKIKQYWDSGVGTEDIPVGDLEEYGNWDVDGTYLVHLKQLEDPRMTPELHKLILLKGLDLLVLQEMEYNGMPYDAEASLKEAEKLSTEIAQIEEKLNALNTTEYKINWDSGDDLSCFLYGGKIIEELYTPETSIIKTGPNKGKERTINRHVGSKEHRWVGFFNPPENGEIKKTKELDDRSLKRWSTAEPVLQELPKRTKVQRSVVELLLRRANLTKVVGTYLTALPALLQSQAWEVIHGQYNQVVARTGRLSSSKPNLQNQPPEADQFFVSRYAD